ncbi:hypothetical protein KKA93_03085 [Patescibacteria group bacterium]|nr:hypothetical protein [Patescibacteria group bacterium]MBU1663159.1 hypothetical protein [Patescibacteria group bacterium]MBU1934255.1 hypothetical protein [Patescibacteria group bacterium]MBU2007686.1 hypothetical protein [Patescibacteria group bacterium]MBU2233836.1 hypothetical protein [Patescibacteria group bacterium]
MATQNNIYKGNLNKVLKTVRGSIKKAIFYLGANIPYDYSLLLVTPLATNINKIKKNYPDLYYLIELDYQIRDVDDILDEKLYKKNPLPIVEIKKQINNFKNVNKDFNTIARLFELELKLHTNRENDLRNKIREIIEIRPCDYFLLIDKIIEWFGSSLSAKDLYNSKLFFKEFQRLRDLLDDIMTAEEDPIKNSYNNIVIAEKNGIDYKFIDNIINNKFNNLNNYICKIKEHPHKRLLKHTIEFWGKQYLILFKPLLVNYYINKEEYKKIYFMFKQV